jgi:homocysteine S-methyltransferase
MTTYSSVTGPDWLHQRLQRGEIILLDGAMGTELEKRGVPMHATGWSAGALFQHVDVVRELHEDYIRAGADVIITNTFATARHMLEPAGYGTQVAELNQRAVKAAIEARDNAADRPVAIAGSISNFMAQRDNPYWLEPQRLHATFREQADILAAAGVDLLALEMLQRPELARVAVSAALETGLPVWVGVSCKRLGSGSEMMTFNYPELRFAETLDAVLQPGIAVINVMHSEVPDTGAGLDQVRQRWAGPLGAYPEAGYFHLPNWEFIDVDDDELLRAVNHWLAREVQLIGGCCGIGVEHIRMLKQRLPVRLADIP